MSEDDSNTIKAQPPETLTIVFHEPLVLGNLTYGELTFRELTAGQYKVMAKQAGVDATLWGLGMSAGCAPKIIEMMPVSLFAEAERFVSGFFKGVRPEDSDA